MNSAMEIEGVRDLVKSGAFVLSEMLLAIAEAGGEMRQKLSECIANGETPRLVFQVLADGSGTVVELVTQKPESLSFTRHAVLPIMKTAGDSLN